MPIKSTLLLLCCLFVTAGIALGQTGDCNNNKGHFPSHADSDVHVTPTGAVTLERGPYLQMASQHGITIRWRTDDACASFAELGETAGSYTISASQQSLTREHELRINGLKADQKYYYRIGTAKAWLQGDTDNFFFTAPSDTCTHKITVAAFGDCGRNDNGFQSGSLGSYQRFLEVKGARAANLMLLLGDNAYQSGTDEEYTDNFFQPYSSIVKNHAIFPCPGNHDYANDPDRQADHKVPYYENFTMPQKGECGGVASGNKAYYSFDWGNIHFISMDSYGLEDSGTTRLYDTAGIQAKWLKADLAANYKKWTIAFWHHPPYTFGSHNSDNEMSLIKIREHFINILERHGADLIICGHSHDYERSYLLKGYYGNEASFHLAKHAVDSSSGRYDGSKNSCPYITVSAKKDHGTVYVVSGSAGADGPVQAGWPHQALPFSQDDGGMLYLEIEDNRLDAKFIRRDSVIADQFTIIKDADQEDTVTIASSDTVQLRASWVGTHLWADGSTGRSIVVAPIHDTVLTVRDNEKNTCLSDNFIVKVKTDTTGHGGGVSVGPDNIFPVPAKNVLYVQLTPAEEADYSFEVYDVLGRSLLNVQYHLAAGSQQVLLDISTMPVSQELLLKVNTLSHTQAFHFLRLP